MTTRRIKCKFAPAFRRGGGEYRRGYIIHKGLTKYRIGLDAGSTTLKAVALDENAQVAFSFYKRHNTHIAECLGECLTKMQSALGDVPASIRMTGSIGMGVAEKCGLPFVQEVVAATRYIAARTDGVKTLIDIGGEDAKIVFFKGGKPSDLRMNGNCAGGTGAFIDQMAILLGVDIDELNALAQDSDHVYSIASRCGVFCKTDIQNLIAKNVSREDIAASIFHAVAVQTVTSLAHGQDIEGPLLFIGGPLTFIPALRKAFIDYLHISESEIILPENSELIPAFGTALSVGADCKGSQKVSGQGIDAALPVDCKGSHRAKHQGLDTAPGCEEVMSLSEWAEALQERLSTRGTRPSGLRPLFADKTEHEEWLKGKLSASMPVGTWSTEGMQEVILGIDSGSTTTKIVALSPDGRLLYSFYSSNEGNPISAAEKGLRGLIEEGQKHDCGIVVSGSCSTGYGEDLLKAAFGLGGGIVETMAHYMAARRINPDVSFILDIGGQDMKAIYVDRGVINDIEINEACSSGCGSFIETFARSLGYGLTDFVGEALSSANPCDLGTRCTVFMNSKVKQVLREGVSVADIAAGLSYSVIKNCLYKVLKLKDASGLGQHIVLQGGTMRNDAVVRAFELETGREVFRSDRPELMGAYGCALYSLEHRSDPVPISDMLGKASYVTSRLQCHGCENNCLVVRYNFGNGNRYYSGNRCERVFTNRGDGSLTGRNAYSEKLRLLFDRPSSSGDIGQFAPSGTSRALSHSDSASSHAADASLTDGSPAGAGSCPARVEASDTLAPATTIGIPRVLNMFEEYPFWHKLFTGCGFAVVLSDPSEYCKYERGARFVMSDNICFPAKLVHSHIQNLEKKGVDRIFMPFVVFEKQDGGQNSFNCPVVSGYSQVVLSGQKISVPLDSPIIGFKDERLLYEQCEEYLRGLGVDKKTIKRAFAAALSEQEKFNTDLARINREILQDSTDRGLLTIMLAGRPYHADPLVQHKLSDIVASMGVNVVTDNLVQGEQVDTSDVHFMSQWSYPNRILKSAKWCARKGDDIQYMQMTSFGCGPDAFFVDEVKTLLQRFGKTLTLLKLDDVNNIGSLKLRVRSAIESLRYNFEAGRSRCEKPFHTTPVFGEDQRFRTILAPFFTPYASPLIPSLFKYIGYNVVSLPLSDASSAEWGLKYANNEICYPATLVVGDFVKAFREGGYDPATTAVAITQTGGQCRASNYISLIKKAMVEAGYGEVPVISLSFSSGLGNYQPGFKIPILKTIAPAVNGLLFSDCISKFYYASVVRERETGAAKLLSDKYMAMASRYIEEGRSGELLDHIGEAAREFDAVCLDKECMRVGIVGEIYLKFHPFAQKDVTGWLISQGIEVAPPLLSTFFMQYFINSRADKDYKLKSSSFGPAMLDWAFKLLWKKTRKVNEAASVFRYFVPFTDIHETASKASRVVPLAAQFGEGWLLPGEIIEFYESGVRHVVSLQPFGCIANHIISKGIEKKLKALYPDLSLLFLDFDSGVSDVNVTNRLLLFVGDLKTV